MESFCNLIKIRLWKFEEDCLKTVEDIFLMQLSFLVCTLRKDSLKAIGKDKQLFWQVDLIL